MKYLSSSAHPRRCTDCSYVCCTEMSPPPSREPHSERGHCWGRGRSSDSSTRLWCWPAWLAWPGDWSGWGRGRSLGSTVMAGCCWWHWKLYSLGCSHSHFQGCCRLVKRRKVKGKALYLIWERALLLTTCIHCHDRSIGIATSRLAHVHLHFYKTYT